MGDSSKYKNTLRTASRGSSGPSNASTGTWDLLSRAELDAQLDAATGPVTSEKDARVWLDTRGWILAGEKYSKPKLADILFTVALTQKLPNDACSAIKALAYLIAEQDFSTTLANTIAEKIATQINSSIDKLTSGIASTKDFLDATTRQQAEATLALQESVTHNTESSKSLANTTEELISSASKQCNNTDWPSLSGPASTSGNVIHPASLLHSMLSAPHIKIQQRTLLAARQLLIELGSLEEDLPPPQSRDQPRIRERTVIS
jgi:hypothetical protein